MNTHYEYTSYCIDCLIPLEEGIGVFDTILDSPHCKHERRCFACGCLFHKDHPQLVESYKRAEEVYLNRKSKSEILLGDT